MSGMSGKVALNSAGDREPNYLLSGTLTNGSEVILAKVVNTGEDMLHQVNSSSLVRGGSSTTVAMADRSVETWICQYFPTPSARAESFRST